MKVSKNDMPKYNALWLTVQGETTNGYADKVLAIVDPDGKLELKRKDVYNVMIGNRKDWAILKAIQQVILSEKSMEIPEVTPQKLNLKNA